jgi:putative resolvase
MLSISAAADFIGVCTKTLRRYESRNLIAPLRTPGGHRRYSMLLLDQFLEEHMNSTRRNEIRNPHTTSIAIYARVSSHEQKQKGDLNRQVGVLTEFCRQYFRFPIKIYTDVGSGLNTGRNGLRKLLHDVKKGNLSRIIIAYKDRLTRFGYEFIEEYCTIFGVQITPIQVKPNQSASEGLTDDIISLMASFSGKLYGMRSAEKKKHRRDSVANCIPSLPTESP